MKSLVYLFIMLWVIACSSLEQNIEITAPDYKSQLVVECYLEPAKPYRLLLTETADYSKGANLPIISNAIVTISHMGIKDTLRFIRSVDTLQRKLYNFGSNTLVKDDSTHPYVLSIVDNTGRRISAITQITGQLIIDSLYYKTNTETQKSAVITTISVNPQTENYYRYYLDVNDSVGGIRNNRLFTNQLATQNKLSTVTTYRFESGDSIWVNVLKINQEYFNYFNSTRAAINANLNPFSQSAPIRSNINGGMGIFTGYRKFRKLITIQ